MVTSSDHPAPLQGQDVSQGLLWGQGERAAAGEGVRRDAETSGSALKEMHVHHHSQFGARSHFKQGKTRVCA